MADIQLKLRFNEQTRHWDFIESARPGGERLAPLLLSPCLQDQSGIFGEGPLSFSVTYGNIGKNRWDGGKASWNL